MGACGSLLTKRNPTATSGKGLPLKPHLRFSVIGLWPLSIEPCFKRALLGSGTLHSWVLWSPHRSMSLENWGGLLVVWLTERLSKGLGSQKGRNDLSVAIYTHCLHILSVATCPSSALMRLPIYLTAFTPFTASSSIKSWRRSESTDPPAEDLPVRKKFELD